MTAVETLRERVFQVFGSQILDDLIDLEYTERTLSLLAQLGDDESGERVFAIRGFVSRPQVQRLNRNSIYLFVNGRLIRDRLLMHALSSAYHNLMPPACYPFALMFLDCDAEEVDVNVHPSKTEVRFRHGTFVHDFLRDTIRSVLMQSRPGSAVPAAASPQPATALPYSEFTAAIDNEQFASAFVRADQPVPVIAPNGDQTQLPEFRLRTPAPPPAQRFDFSEPAAPAADASAEPSSGPVSREPLRVRVPDTHGGFPDSAAEQPASMQSLTDLRPLGQLHNSFIIAAGRDGLWIIDQHVAHERILFEQVLAARADAESSAAAATAACP